jgi:acyl dehydratase
MTRPEARAAAVGDEIGPLVVAVDRARLVRYAGASGDFNPIHWNERVATAVGLDGVIAHGMLTMALAGRLVTDWAGDPGAVASFDVRFTRPVVVPDPGAVDVTIAGRVADITAGDDGSRTARIDLIVTVDGKKVLGKARATVRLAQEVQ